MTDQVLYKKVLEILEDEDMANQVIHVLEEEKRREKIRRHRIQMEGIKRAKARGITLGRPMKSLPENFHTIYKAFKSGELSAMEAAELCQMGVSTFYRKVREYSQKL